jgi:hypothetical protein
MDNFKKKLKLSYVLNNLIGNQLKKRGKSKLFLNEQISSITKDGLKVKLRKFYYKWVAYFINKEYKEKPDTTEVKYYKAAGVLEEPNYIFILSYIFSGESTLRYFHLKNGRSKDYTLDSATNKWTLEVTSEDITTPGHTYYNDAMGKLIDAATASGATYGGVTYKMVAAPATSPEWVNAFPASEIFEGFDEYSKSLLSPMRKAIKKQ